VGRSQPPGKQLDTVSIRLDRNTIGYLLAGAGVDAWGVADSAADGRLPLAPDLPTAIVVLRRLRPAALKDLERGPTPAYRSEYRLLNRSLDEATALLADTLEAHGHRAQSVPATSAAATAAEPLFSHKSAATRAGLGWIGKTALFVSRDFGAAVRLATVFTDLQLAAGKPLESGQCGACRVCVDACPAGAGRDVQWSAGAPREELFDAFACERHLEGDSAGGMHGICGICVAVCPFTRSALRRTRGA
jgi:epoxyqueuosine reductase